MRALLASPRRPAGSVVLLFGALLHGCAPAERDAAERTVASPTPPVESVFTAITPTACREEVDTDDPNETPHLVCAGAAGYTLRVRRVEAGRVSIDVVDPGQRAFPLDYQEVVTRAMSSLDGQAEWRVATTDSVPVPIAIIARVQVREDDDDPARITRTWVAVAKITPDDACVTDRIEDDIQAEADLRRLADSARERPCAAALPADVPPDPLVR